MSVLNFPNNPAAQTPVNTFSPTSTPESSTNGVTYIYNATNGAWTAESSSSGPSSGAPATIISDVTPSTREDGTPIRNGDLWWDSSIGTLFIYYVDIDGGQWVQATAVDSESSDPVYVFNNPLEETSGDIIFNINSLPFI